MVFINIEKTNYPHTVDRAYSSVKLVDNGIILKRKPLIIFDRKVDFSKMVEKKEKNYRKQQKSVL